MNHDLSHALVRKRLLAEFGPDLLTLLETVAIEMGDEMAYNLASAILERLSAKRSANGAALLEAGDGQR